MFFNDLIYLKPAFFMQKLRRIQTYLVLLVKESQPNRIVGVEKTRVFIKQWKCWKWNRQMFEEILFLFYFKWTEDLPIIKKVLELVLTQNDNMSLILILSEEEVKKGVFCSFKTHSLNEYITKLCQYRWVWLGWILLNLSKDVLKFKFSINNINKIFIVPTPKKVKP